MATKESVEAAEKANDVSSNAVVTVASKLPFDLIVRLYDFVEKQAPVMGGGFTKYKISQERRGVLFTFLGNSFAQNDSNHQEIAYGFGITRDIPKDFWDEWLEQNKDADYVKNGMIFAFQNANSTKAKAREMENVKSNLERLDPKHLPMGLTTSDESRALMPA